MKQFSHILNSIQNIVNEFDGSVSLKNRKRQYFFVNDKWLDTVKLESTQVIGKTDEEILPAANAAFIKKTDLEAVEQNNPVRYINKTILNGKEITYIAVKWVVKHSSGEPFCYCTAGDMYENKENVLAILQKIHAIFENELIRQSDFSIEK